MLNRFSRLVLMGIALMTVFAAKAQNPAISAIYTPDPAPYVHGDKVYLFVDHDEDEAGYVKLQDWLVPSTEDMVNRTYLGAPVSTATVAWAKQGDREGAAQAVEHKGKWYWYLCCNTADGKEALCVAVADNPQGPWKDAIGKPLATGFGFIDPTVFIDDDGTPYLFWGNKGFWYGKLNDDMISFADGYKEVPGYTDPKSFGALQSKMDWSIGRNREMTQYEEGPWVTKQNGMYYAVYPAGGVPEYMAYSTAPTVNGPWTFRGRIMNEAENSFTIHDGKIPFIPFTKEGVKPVGKLDPTKRVEAETMASSWGVKLDRKGGKDHYVSSVHNGDWIKLSNVDLGEGNATAVNATIGQLKNAGSIEFFIDKLDGSSFAKIDFGKANETKEGRITGRDKPKGTHDVYILFRGGDEELFDLDWWKIQ